MAGGLGLFLGGCARLSPPEGPLFPEEILPGWSKEAEGPLPPPELPQGASGGWGAVWRIPSAWIWAEVLTLADAGRAAATFAEIVASLARPAPDPIGEEGVRVELTEADLVLHLFRGGPSLALVGSLATDPLAAPDPSRVREAARVLAQRLPYPGPPAFALPPAARPLAQASERAPAAELLLPLKDDAGQILGTLAFRLYGHLLGEAGGSCRYRLFLHLAGIALGEVPPDGPLRGPLDLFLAGLMELPCGRVTFLTPELALLKPGEAKAFEPPGPLLGEMECVVPCSLPTLRLDLNLVVRDHDDDLLDFLRAFVLWLGPSDPQAAALEGVVEEVVRRYGPPADHPPDPFRAAQSFPGTSLGGGSGGDSLPTDLISGGVKLEFSGQLAIAGSCSTTSPKAIWCRVPEGARGVLTLQAKRTPAGAVHIRAEALPPGWPAFPGAFGWGTVASPYAFTVPGGTAGQRFVLRFRAGTAGVTGELEVQVILDGVPAEAGGRDPGPGV